MKNRKLVLYVAAVCILFLFCIIEAYSFDKTSITSLDVAGIIFFIFLSIITESSLVPVKYFGVSSGFAITTASLFLFGPFWTMVIVSLGVALRVRRDNNNYIGFWNTPFYKTLFNISTMSLSIYCASRIYTFSSAMSSDIFFELVKFTAFVTIFLIVNTLTISILIRVLSNADMLSVYMSNLKFGLLNIVAMAPFGVMLAYLYRYYKVVGVLIVMVPVMLARYTYILYLETKSRYMQTIQVLMNAMEARDKYTEGHSRRVAEIVKMIAKELKYNDRRIDQLTIASMVHDIGKIGIDDSILNKPGKLDDKEYTTIKGHPEIGYNIVKDIKDIGDIPDLVRYHHERYDGKGYPFGKDNRSLGTDIFIIQLADCIDAMATDRPYRKAMSEEAIIDELKKNSGSQFHPQVVEAYLRVIERKRDRM